MKKYLLAFLLPTLILSTVLFSPAIVHGQRSSLPSQIVPEKCTGQDGMCGWNDLLTTVNNFITFLLYVSVAVATFTLGFAGFGYYTSLGDPSKVQKSKNMIGKTMLGFLFIFTAWLIVQAILTGLGLQNGFSLLI